MRKAKLSTQPLFRYFKAIKKPTLVIFGAQDEYQYGDVPKVASLLKVQKPEFIYKIVKDGDHGLSTKQKELAKITIGWMKYE